MWMVVGCAIARHVCEWARGCFLCSSILKHEVLFWFCWPFRISWFWGRAGLGQYFLQQLKANLPKLLLNEITKVLCKSFWRDNLISHMITLNLASETGRQDWRRCYWDKFSLIQFSCHAIGMLKRQKLKQIKNVFIHFKLFISDTVSLRKKYHSL